MNQKQATPLAKEWLAGDKATRTRIQQSLHGTKAMQAFLEALANQAPVQGK